ncbi:serine serine/threonine-protein phosphatase 4 regulatory subunit 2-like [Solea senegalensis]|uniref:Serine serine/threonine-protein phosphatase 4 regulatory subunit 2-like n=1 Tax=Solea senegalensis TaxID=28829 RepID=A0AAV6SW59_SOLSE|nr:serine/threonine-protein phosphatase 4 regulatory subunit 2-A-like isoform X3 [Solea senegalensis]KAG7520955.1 serine serine/threonine-protein phosphatase 4 regulatory subunit 2-like [Solea senegalensis]
MDIDALLDAFQDFDKKGKKETCPVLEQFLCHVAKTGQPLLGSPISSRISWSQFKSYFMFKLEKVMDDFHTSMPEQRGPNNPNVEYIPFEEMKTRILKIVDGYNGIPFTIQRLCELLMDPKRNYTGTDKFLRGLEKNVMVVSCVYPTSDRNINGPSTPKPLHRPKLSMSSSLSTNGLPDYLVSKEPEPTTEENEEHHISDSSLSEGELSPNSGVKNKHPEEDDSSDSEEHEVKRLKFDEQEEDETEKEEEEKESEASCKMSGSLSEMPDSLQDSCGQECQSGTSCDTTCDDEPSSRTETSEREEESSATEDVHSPKNDDTVDQPDLPAPSEKSTSFEQDNVEESSSGNSDGEDLSSNKQLPSSGSSSPDLSTEGDADNSNITETAKEPGEHD